MLLISSPYLGILSTGNWGEGLHGVRMTVCKKFLCPVREFEILAAINYTPTETRQCNT